MRNTAPNAPDIPNEPTRRPARHGKAGPFFAAIDLGTSNCRLMIAASHGRGLRIVDSVSRVVRLGEDLAATGRLGEPAMARALASLETCAHHLARHRIAALDAVATEATRRATNGPEFLARIHARTGLAVRTITAREEAALIVESCTPFLTGTADARRALIFDIGGGSTELAWVRLGATPELIATESFPFGVVTLPAALGLDPFRAHDFDRAAAAVAASLDGFDRIHRISREIAAGGVRLLGTSGTVTTLAGEALGLPRYDRRAIDGIALPLDAATDAVTRLRALGRPRLAAHPCVGRERVDLVLAGCAIFEAIRRLWPLPAVTVADRGLREGILARLIRTHAQAQAQARARAARPPRAATPIRVTPPTAAARPIALDRSPREPAPEPAPAPEHRAAP